MVMFVLKIQKRKIKRNFCPLPNMVDPASKKKKKKNYQLNDNKK